MKIEPKAFLAIERSMAAAMRAEWDKLASEVVAKLHDAISRKDWATAQKHANELTLKGVVTKVRPRLEELAVSALLFGAHRVTKDVKTTSFMNGAAIPHALQHGLNQLEHAVEHDASDYVRKAVHKAIEELKRQDETAHVQKDDVYTEKSKRPDNQTAEDYEPDPDVDGATAKRQEALLGRAGWQQKDDVSEAELAATGGLLEPEQGGGKKKKKQWVTKTEGPKTLYVNRPLLNANELIAWAETQGFKSVSKPEDMHVTICYAKEPFDWDDLEPAMDNVTIVNGERELHQFGDAVVLVFDSPLLAEEHDEFMRAGASFDYPEYHSHVTITWQGAPRPLNEITPFDGNLQFGPQEFAAINDDWKADHQEIALRKAEKTLTDMLNDAVVNGGKVATDVGAQLTTSRLVSLGFLSEAQKAGHSQYQVDEVLDDRTCPVCEYMNGKTFDVDAQFSRVVQQLSTSDPQDLKDLAPWPGQGEDDLQELYAQSAEELQAAGLGGPPYHPGCRGMLSLVGEVEETVPLGGPLSGEDEGSEGSDEPVPFTVPPLDDQSTDIWTENDIKQLGWDRFDVTDPDVFKEVDDAYQAGDYDAAQAMIDDWKNAQPVEKAEDATKPDEDQGFEGPNAPKKKRQAQTPKGREQDYGDIRSDSSSIAFDSGVTNDANGPIDKI
jgi:hypothetical protein